MVLGFLKKYFSKKVGSLNLPKNSRQNESAIISKAAYMNDNDRIKYLTEKLPGYAIDNSLSSSKTLVAVNPETKEVITGFRGSKDRQDIGTDLLIGLGLEKLGSRYRNGVKTARRVQEKYGDYNSSYTGHSLGGKIAYDVGGKVGKESNSFDTPGSIPSYLGFKSKDGGNNNAKLYSTLFDPIGFSGNYESGERKMIVPKLGNSPHSIDNWVE
jgi:hypothetical protein